MVGQVKKWLGIDVLERENAARADEILVLTERIKRIDAATADAINAASDTLAQVVELQKQLTEKPARPKIVAKPARTNWRNFRTAAERATEPEQEQSNG